MTHSCSWDTLNFKKSYDSLSCHLANITSWIFSFYHCTSVLHTYPTTFMFLNMSFHLFISKFCTNISSWNNLPLKCTWLISNYSPRLRLETWSYKLHTADMLAANHTLWYITFHYYSVQNTFCFPLWLLWHRFSFRIVSF